MKSETGLPRLRCIYKRNKFEVEGHAAASFESDSRWKSNGKLICHIVDGLAVGVRHQRQDEADVPAQSLLFLRLCTSSSSRTETRIASATPRP